MNQQTRIDELDAAEASPGPKATPAPEKPAAEPAPAKRKSRKGRVIFGLLAAGALAAGADYGYGWWTEGRFMVGTDDAYVQADMAEISARIQGYVTEVEVQENQRVKAGEPLLRLDDGDHRIALETARTRVATLDQTLARIDAQIEAAQAAVAQAEAERQATAARVRNAELSPERARDLAGRKVVAQAQLDDATAELDAAQANLAGADAQIQSAKANVAVLRAQRAETAGQQDELRLAVAQAERDLDLTVLRAPIDGVVTHLVPELGDLVSAGQRLAAIVPTDGLYIEANYKETQLADIAPGATARITVDALPGRVFEGKVTSTAPATGSQFSLLPADNATGNFTKIVQRVPVRIALPDDAEDLRAGLSVVVEIDERTAPGARPAELAAAAESR